MVPVPRPLSTSGKNAAILPSFGWAQSNSSTIRQAFVFQHCVSVTAIFSLDRGIHEVLTSGTLYSQHGNLTEIANKMQTST